MYSSVHQVRENVHFSASVVLKMNCIRNERNVLIVNVTLFPRLRLRILQTSKKSVIVNAVPI